MKRILFILLSCMITMVAFSQQLDTTYAKEHRTSTLAILKAYGYLAERSQMYGGGLSSERYNDPVYSNLHWGLCEGWKMNFFVIKKYDDGTHTVEYIKLWQVHHAMIREENGFQYLYIYPMPGQLFEKRTWNDDNNDGQNYKTDEVYWIKMYIDWGQEDGLIEKFKAAFDLWGKFNSKEFNDTETFY